MIEDNGIILVTGESGSGKTRFCTAYSNELREQGWRIGGILSPAVFDGDTKVAIEAMNVANGERKLLATLAPGKPEDILVGIWALKPETIAWGNRIFQTTMDVDCVIVDELGPLEFFGGGGWQSAMQILEAVGGRIKQALVVVRPALRDEAYRRFRIVHEINLNQSRVPN
ncbi:MAG: nucleoside-triphosphatase [Anaerolineales bacterium]